MLLNNMLDKIVTMFCRPNLEIQTLLAMAIFRAPSAYLPPEYILRKFQMLLYFIVIVNKLLCIPSSHYWLRETSATTPALDENHKAELDYLKRKIIWNIELSKEKEQEKKKEISKFHESFKLNSKLKYLKLERSACIIFLYFSSFKRKVWNNELIQCRHEGTIHSWLHLVSYRDMIL